MATFLASLSSTESSSTACPTHLLPTPTSPASSKKTPTPSPTLDEGKPRQEVMVAEIGVVIGRALKGAKELESWAWRAMVEEEAKGVVLIISPWNWPIILAFQTLCSAIADGCPALIKPSEVVPTFSQLLSALVPKYLDQAAYRVALSGIPERTSNLELKWAHIGNGRVARIISAAAAKHLTPMTSSWPGRAPGRALVVAAGRLVWGRLIKLGR
ncbi:Aldehyde/histidinol dehydrogenase [Ephemerocybe angulata]|uniref:Aldehyde/histidinol dehydrogenase n=1 Tax=Ephemerocybe angulata TaxID=980116 RepID=A0A8H6H9Q2_9AGAR|nr:Aldehyde/histidinol dehydrogenase [Tulosesus angulatus]